MIDYLCSRVEEAGGENHQTVVNDALLEDVCRQWTVELVGELMREDLALYAGGRKR